MCFSAACDLDTGTDEVFYRPRPREDLATAVVVVPRLETLVRFQGSLAAPVRNIQLHGFVSLWERTAENGR